jgi:hypothetical protein
MSMQKDTSIIEKLLRNFVEALSEPQISHKLALNQVLLTIQLRCWD